MKHAILSLKMKGDFISGQSLMLWFQKDSLDIVGFGTFRVGSGFPKLNFCGRNFRYVSPKL